MRDGWKKVAISDVCIMIKRGQAPSYTENKSVTVLNQKCIRDGRINLEFSRQTDANLKPINEWAYLNATDTLVNSTGVGTLGRVAFVRNLPEPTTVDSHVTIVRPDNKKVEPSFLGLSLNFREADIEGLAAGSSGQTELSREALGNLIITLPTLPEQKRIVDLISSIDSYVEALQQQLENVKRSRNAVLHELLTAGGDDWVETTLGNVCDFVNGDRGKNYPSAKFRQSHGIPFINAGHLDKGIVNFDSMDFISEEVFQKLGSGKVQPGDTLFCLRGSVGKFANVEDLQKGAIASSLVIIRPNSQITREFLMHYLDSDLCSSELKQSLTGAVQPNLSANNLKSFKISLPTLGKQIEIGDLLGQFNSSITAVSSLLESTRNLRSGILSDLLSGKHEIPASYDKVIGAA